MKNDDIANNTDAAIYGILLFLHMTSARSPPALTPLLLLIISISLSLTSCPRTGHIAYLYPLYNPPRNFSNRKIAKVAQFYTHKSVLCYTEEVNRSLDKYHTIYRHLWQTYGAFWTVRISYLMQFVSAIGRLIIIPIALSQIIAHLSARDFDGAIRAMIVYIAVSLAVGIFTPLIKYVGMLGENKAYRMLTTRYFSRLITTDLSFFNSNLAGYLTTSTRHYVDGCMKLVRGVRDKYLSTVLRIVSPLVVITWLNVWLGLVTLGLTVVQGAYLLYASRAIDPFRTKSREIYKRNSGRMSDVISNILAVRAAAQEETYAAQIERGAHAENEAYAKRYIMAFKLIGIREIITVVFIAILLSLTIMLTENGSIDLAAAILVITYVATILAGIYSLSDNLDEHDDFIDQILPAFEILNRDNAVKDPASPVEVKRFRGEITFDNVSFAYEDSGLVLDTFSLTTPPVRKLASSESVVRAKVRSQNYCYGLAMLTTAQS